ncbi:uncharacterized protein LOC107822574 [Nicotiana tabacum]|uniref:uncharacterized protein LOC107822574 n=1 Tax=Nicotiana tabacum TaxID=4097 RepID=UPI003F4F112C
MYLLDVTIDGIEVPVERSRQGSNGVASPPPLPPILEVEEERMVKDGFSGFSDDLHDFGDNEMNSYGMEDADGAEELPDIVSRAAGDEGLVDSLATQHTHPDDFNQNLTYWRRWKVGEIAQAMIRGTQEEGYALLEAYRHVMLSYNEGSILDLKLDHKLYFRYFFLSIGAFIKGFAHMRKVIAVDGTFLSGRYEGCLLSAVAQDIENQIFSIALCVVDEECDDSWTYVLNSCGTLLTTMMNSALSLIDICLLGMASKTFFLPLIMSYITEEFFDHFQQLRDKSREVANCLTNEIGFQKWSRVFFPGNRYGVLTTNIAESLNAMLKDQRDFPIISLFNLIIQKFTEKFEERRNEIKNVLTLFVPSAKKKIRNNRVVGDALRVHQLENNQSVVGHDRDAIVDLDLNTCSCCQFDLEKIPCPHAMAALRLSFGDGYGSSIYNHSSPFYKVSTYLAAYKGTIHTIPTEEKWVVPDEIQSTKILPPDVEPTKGKRKFKR